jgi:hypothetical protein
MRREPPAGKARPWAAALLVLCGAFLGSFWYSRNLAWFGNPFYPLGSPNFVDPTPVQFGPNLGSLVGNLRELVNVRIYDHSTMYGPNVDEMAGWGPAAFACGLIAVVPAVRDSLAMRRLAAAFLLSLVSTLLLVQVDPWCLKYVFFFPAILAIAAARAAEQSRPVLYLVGGALAFCFIGTFLSFDLRREHVGPLVSQSWRTRSAAVFPHAEAQQDVPDDAIAYFGSETGAPYVLYRPDFSRRVVYLRAETVDGLHFGLRQAGVRTLFAPSPSPLQERILQDAMRRRILKPRVGRFFEVES